MSAPLKGAPLLVTISDIYIIKLKGDVVMPTKSKFYRRPEDDNFKRKIKW